MVPISTEEPRGRRGSVTRGDTPSLVLITLLISSWLSSGLFSCEGRYDEDCCRYKHHAINPYQSYEARILFSTWNLDHLVERSRTVVPALVRAVQASVLHSHWSSSNEARLSLVESFIAPVLLCHKEPACRIQSPCSSLVLYGTRIVGFHARKGPIIDAILP